MEEAKNVERLAQENSEIAKNEKDIDPNLDNTVFML